MKRGKNLNVWPAMSMFLLLIVSTAAAGTIYVDDDANGINDGSSWTDAYRYLQDALADANSGDEIWVAQGIYKPDQEIGITPGGRTATFQLKNGVSIKGGYAGFGEPDPNVRDFELYETIMSGDLAGNDVQVNDPCDLLTEPTRAENSYHVVTAIETDGTAELDGFTITGGNVNEYGPWPLRFDNGGGMYNEFGSPIISNCKLICNSARHGGGMYNHRGSPTLTSCTFRGNAASSGGGLYNISGRPNIINCAFRRNSSVHYGGGICYTSTGPSGVTLTNCTFSKNWSGAGGGVYDGSYGAPIRALTLNNCRFISNSAVKGGGMCIGHSRQTLNNCMFIGNSADFGGAAAHYDLAISTYSKCTFTANSAQYGKAISCSSWRKRSPNIVRLNNCIVWNGGQEIYNDNNSIITIIYSDMQGSWPGEGNIDVDPCFADANNGDYHLKSRGGRWDANEGRWTKDEVTSPCIDGGDMASPIGLEPFPNGGRINMGAYGGMEQASKSYFGKPPCQTIVAGDINGDCNVNFRDLAFMAFHWLEDRRPFDPNSIIRDGIEYYIHTDKSFYELGEHTEILFRITNLTDEVWRVGSMVRIMDIIVEIKEGESFREVWRYGWRNSTLPGPQYLGLQPGESTVLGEPWPQISMMRTGDPWDYNQAPPGTYRITGVVDGYRTSPEPPMDIHSSVSVDITVVY